MDGIPDRERIALLLIDMQEAFRKAIPDIDAIIERASLLARTFKALGLPIIYTQQYTKGLGASFPELGLEGTPIEKTEFSCFRNADFLRALEKSGAKQLAICGIEAHVCVLQTALDAVSRGLEVFLVEDAISSRKESDKQTAIARASQSGVFRSSSEMLIFQLLGRAGTEEFREIHRIIRHRT